MSKEQIIVVNVRNTVQGYSKLLIDRRSVFGNPFYMNDESQRDAVCDKYAEYFPQALKMKPALNAMYADLLKRVIKGEKIQLMCHCAPKRCHGDTVKEYLLKHQARFTLNNGKLVLKRHCEEE